MRISKDFEVSLRELFPQSGNSGESKDEISNSSAPNDQDSAAKVYLKPLERLAIFAADSVPRLSLSDNQAQTSGLALHPGSGSEKKNWPEQKWAELSTYLVNHSSLKLLLVGGEAEGERLQRLTAALPAHRVRLAQSLPLVELGRLLAKCAGFVGHDSGISHLAAALGVPLLLLWGDTKPEVWKPPGKSVTIINSADGLEKLPVTDVIQALRGLRLFDDNVASGKGLA